MPILCYFILISFKRQLADTYAFYTVSINILINMHQRWGGGGRAAGVLGLHFKTVENWIYIQLTIRIKLFKILQFKIKCMSTFNVALSAHQFFNNKQTPYFSSHYTRINYHLLVYVLNSTWRPQIHTTDCKGRKGRRWKSGQFWATLNLFVDMSWPLQKIPIISCPLCAHTANVTMSRCSNTWAPSPFISKNSIYQRINLNVIHVNCSFWLPMVTALWNDRWSPPSFSCQPLLNHHYLRYKGQGSY